jgi:oxygen-independent coproporphyrinogen-3 oxidase
MEAFPFIDVLGRHDRPGPRYTSYPSAPHFNESFGEEDQRRHILQSN